MDNATLMKRLDYRRTKIDSLAEQILRDVDSATGVIRFIADVQPPSVPDRGSR